MAQWVPVLNNFILLSSTIGKHLISSSSICSLPYWFFTFLIDYRLLIGYFNAYDRGGGGYGGMGAYPELFYLYCHSYPPEFSTIQRVLCFLMIDYQLLIGYWSLFSALDRGWVWQ